MSKIKIFSLGGLNEIGKNMYVVEVDKDIFVFDAGLKYPDDKLLGVDYILPNSMFIKDINNYLMEGKILVLNSELAFKNERDRDLLIKMAKDFTGEKNEK